MPTRLVGPQVTTEPSLRNAANAPLVEEIAITGFLASESAVATLLLSPPSRPQVTTAPPLLSAANAVPVETICTILRESGAGSPTAPTGNRRPSNDEATLLLSPPVSC